RPHDADLQPRRTQRVAAQGIGQAERNAIHGARGRHAKRHESDAPEILNRVEQARPHDPERGAHDAFTTVTQSKVPASTARAMRSNLLRSRRWKETRSPGARKTGCSRRLSNIHSGVRPIRCQPPGLSKG